MSNSTVGEGAIAVVRRNTEEVQGKGDWALFEEFLINTFSHPFETEKINARRS
jgi:hypothetical protein